MFLTRTKQIIFGSGIAIPVALLTITLVRATGWIPARTPIQYAQEHNPNLVLTNLEKTPDASQPVLSEEPTKTPINVTPPVVETKSPTIDPSIVPIDTTTGTSEGAVPEQSNPAPAATQPAAPSIPAWKTTRCQTTRDAVVAARNSLNYTEVLSLLKSASCWERKADYLYYKVFAYRELGRFKDCIAAGQSSTDERIIKLVNFCNHRLNQ